MSTIIENLKQLPDDITKSSAKDFTLMALVPGKDGKTDKLPINLHSGAQLAWKKHSEQLATFSECIQALQQNKTKWKQLRLGVLLHPQWEDNDDLIVIDIDHRPDLVEQARSGKITSSDKQAKVVKYGFEKGFYIEVSQSGEGLHLIQLGHKHNIDLIRNDLFEYYDRNRWICLTGDCVHTTGDNCLGVNDEIFEELEEIMFTPEERQKQKPQLTAVVNNTAFKTQDIKNLLQKAGAAKNGQTFKELYSGASPSGDISSDDLSFVNLLAFWTQKNPKEMDTIFRGSGRMRPKWDEIHSADGQTYGQMTINAAIANVQDVYTPPKKLPKVDKSTIKSNADLIKALVTQRMLWDKAHTTKNDKEKHIQPIANKPTEIINILINTINFAVIYTEDPKIDRTLYYYDYDEGIYSQDTHQMEQFILAVAPEITVTKTRQNILDTIYKLPTKKVPVVQNIIASEKGKDLLAVGNGVLNLKTKGLTPFSPDIYATSKIDTPYNPNASVEPVINGWSWSKSLKVIADGDLDKLKLLWQVCKAAIIGAYWLRQAVLLIDDGHGMTGKSTFEDALIGVVGKSNTAQLRLAEMSDETKLVDALDKRLIVGDDNDVYTVINRYDYLNPVISSELIRVRNYYEKSQSTTLHTFVLQSCNGIPPFQNATTAFFNRLKMIQFNHRHDAANIGDWRVKNDYIKRPEFREWLLWYVVNKVKLGISLTNTQENVDLIAETKTESDTIKNFLENWLPNLSSDVIPVPWLYDYYATSCVIDNLQGNILSQRRFTREIMNRDDFRSHWNKKRTRVNPTQFLFADVQQLMDLYNSTRWGKDLKTWFPITTHSEGDENTKNTVKIITKDDYIAKLKSYTGNCFIRKYE